MNAILHRLDSFNEFGESSDARQIRKDAAEEIRRLMVENERLSEAARAGEAEAKVAA